MHVLRDAIYVPNFHTFGGLRLLSNLNQSLVVKVQEGGALHAERVGTDVEDGIPGGTLLISDIPAHGVTTVNADRTVTYTPDPDWFGVDAFIYTVQDLDGADAAATVTVTVNPVNDLPTAVDDTDAADMGTPVVIPVLANDLDVEGFDPTTLAVTSPPANGSTSVDTVAGTITYDPDPAFNGADTFTYSVDDTDGATVSATVTVYVGQRRGQCGLVESGAQPRAQCGIGDRSALRQQRALDQHRHAHIADPIARAEAVADEHACER